MRFQDRKHAGRLLSERLVQKYGSENPVVLGLPRGGVPVAFEVAQALHAPLDVIVARKLGAPMQPEFGFGAIAPGARYVDPYTVRMLGLSDAEIESIAAREGHELERRIELYRGGRPRPDVSGRTVVLVDDGLATGVTAHAAIASLKRENPRKIVFAIPVGAPDSVAELEGEGVIVECLDRPAGFQAVGSWYDDFRQTSDDEVLALLQRASAAQKPVGTKARAAGEGRIHYRAIEIDIGQTTLSGDLHVPEQATTIVIFAHGSGSSRFSPRNRYVAEVLQAAGHATLLFDLLSPAEEEVDLRIGHLRFDIDLLAARLVAVTEWVRQQGELRNFAIGYFGASTGAAAAIVAAAEVPDAVKAVVSRGGRPDLGGDALEKLQTPTLLIVGSLDQQVIRLNEAARRRMRAPNELVLIPGATHLFEEAGTLEQVAAIARDWFSQHLVHEPEELSESYEERPWE